MNQEQSTEPSHLPHQAPAPAPRSHADAVADDGTTDTVGAFRGQGGRQTAAAASTTLALLEALVTLVGHAIEASNLVDWHDLVRVRDLVDELLNGAVNRAQNGLRIAECVVCGSREKLGDDGTCSRCCVALASGEQ